MHTTPAGEFEGYGLFRNTNTEFQVEDEMKPDTK